MKHETSPMRKFEIPTRCVRYPEFNPSRASPPKEGKLKFQRKHARHAILIRSELNIYQFIILLRTRCEPKRPLCLRFA